MQTASVLVGMSLDVTTGICLGSEALVGIVDRKMREILGASRSCSKTEAALLCALDYCSERIKIQRKNKALESRLSLAETALEESMEECESLRRELDALKSRS